MSVIESCVFVHKHIHFTHARTYLDYGFIHTHTHTVYFVWFHTHMHARVFDIGLGCDKLHIFVVFPRRHDTRRSCVACFQGDSMRA
jgi:hypothetical protein